MFDLNDITFASRLSESRIQETLRLANQLTNDPQRDIRLARHECKPCFYRQSIAGQAFTAYECKLCETTHQHPNTNTPDLCGPCADQNHLCQRCGADLDGPAAAKLRTEPPIPAKPSAS